jgi:nitrogen-specific signal transduction histidine kinase
MPLTGQGAATARLPYSAGPVARPAMPGIDARRWVLENGASARELLQNLPDAVILLDEHWHILFANREALSLFRRRTLESVVGQLPGDVLHCIHASDGPDRCGTAPACLRCGLSSAILLSRDRNEKTTGDCCVTSNAGGTVLHEIRTTASPMVMSGIFVTMVVLKDTSGEKQRQVLEGLFFHDVLNTISGLCGLAHALQAGDVDPEEDALYHDWLVELTTSLEDEIQRHRGLLLAERGEYVCDFSEVALGQVLKELCALYARHPSATGRSIRLDDPGMVTLSTDAVLLRRVLGNLLKNAIEATPTGGAVRLDVRECPGEVRITIRNPGAIPPEVSARLFQRFFSTKGGPGRGLGAYSAKLFSEQYLKGRLEFTSCVCEGTAFTLSLPRSL